MNPSSKQIVFWVIKTNLGKFKRLKLQSTFSNHNGSKLEIYNRKISKKSSHILESKLCFQIIHGLKIKEIRRYFELNENNAKHENLWGVSGAMLYVHFIELNAYITKSFESVM